MQDASLSLRDTADDRGRSGWRAEVCGSTAAAAAWRGQRRCSPREAAGCILRRWDRAVRPRGDACGDEAHAKSRNGERVGPIPTA